MGGNAFENTQRLSEAEYCEAVKQILDVIDQIGIRASVPPALQDKASHGDIDVFVVTSDIRGVTKTVQEALGATKCKTLGDGMGFIYTKERFQVDLIPVRDVFFELAVATRSHGRFIHLLNMALRKQALAMTDEGLKIMFSKGRSRSGFTVCTDLQEITRFFRFPPSIFDGKTRFTSKQIVEVICQCPFFDVHEFRHLKSWDNLLQLDVFAALLGHITMLSEEECEQLHRDVGGENKAGRIAAKTYGYDFDLLKGRVPDSAVKRKFHGGFFVSLVPELRQHKELLKRMPELLLESVGHGDWHEVQEWCDKTSEEEKKGVLEEIVAEET